MAGAGSGADTRRDSDCARCFSDDSTSNRPQECAPVRSTVIAEALDLRKRELLLVLVLTALVLLLGLWPGSVLDITRTASEAWVAPFR